MCIRDSEGAHLILVARTVGGLEETDDRVKAAAFPGEDPMTLKTPEDIAPVFVELADPACTRHGERVDAQ